MPVVLPNAHAATVPSRKRSAGAGGARGLVSCGAAGSGVFGVAGRASHAWRLHDEGREAAEQYAEQQVHGGEQQEWPGVGEHVRAHARDDAAEEQARDRQLHGELAQPFGQCRSHHALPREPQARRGQRRRAADGPQASDEDAEHNVRIQAAGAVVVAHWLVRESCSSRDVRGSLGERRSQHSASAFCTPPVPARLAATSRQLACQRRSSARLPRRRS